MIVHRAILGSVERMFAILTEHYAGKWPFWLNPRQVGGEGGGRAASTHARWGGGGGRAGSARASGGHCPDLTRYCPQPFTWPTLMLMALPLLPPAPLPLLRQVMVVPISEGAYEYAREVRSVIRAAGMYVDADLADKKMQKKVGGLGREGGGGVGQRGAGGGSWAGLEC